MSLRRVSFYSLYFVAAFVVFAFLCFPQEPMAKKISTRMGKIFPYISLKTDRATPSFPFGIKCENPEIMVGNLISIPFDTFKLGFSLLDLLNTDKDIRFSGTLLGGAVNGKTEAVSFSRNDFSTFKLNLSGIQIKNFPYKTPDAQMDLSFELDGRYASPDEKDGSQNSGTLILKQMTAGIQNALLNRMGIDLLEFSHIEIDFLQDKNRIFLSKCIAQGNVMTIRVTGTLTPATDIFQPPENWTLDLKGFFQPQPAFIPKLAGVSSMASLFKDNQKQGIPIRITGPVKAPEIKL
ncbi:MAG: type II secretion system protein GspN [Proteobacteria bacterium]|nr:type II secretion system protein GspN [Pseudomonadota bacterium]MBU4131359.1 type II secretion system protein GspN [Pseudomonadota bacterium]